MGGICRRHGKSNVKCWSENLRGRGHVVSLDVDERITSK
jgi:hypothetical protein